MSTFKKFVKKFFARFKPYRVHVEFWIDHSVVTHRAVSYSDALDWARCYPRECVVNINWFGKRVAMVGQR